ncbi:MAG: DUF448 domain-containing protein [Candidatus Cloacimonetes bacterium]|nr:DUF448 domain-containing protein [Candidatus Cloacimonadota bacterium]MCF7813495.1 DUF448 domain-containing protein [Candidatus Cloacimonadota bacterium]MCF7868582.1 DUF448 domain-containing protein [Candidatus Cloacimonadota bacterium]MCF7883369.1 DUF448 domain-containing protein [Candidatus Cloacimonadota bacterium]
MSNGSSHANHVPQRTCVICRQKKEKYNFLRFIVVKGSPIFDLKQKLQQRGSYVCDDNDCLSKLKRWISKKGRKIK